MPSLCLIQLVYKTGVYLDFLNLFLFGIQSLIFESERFVYSSFFLLCELFLLVVSWLLFCRSAYNLMLFGEGEHF